MLMIWSALNRPILPQILHNIFHRKCHGLSIALAGFFLVPCVVAQRPGGPAADEVLIRAAVQESEGSVHRLRGAAVVETTEMILRADEIDYDAERGYAEARGNVRFDHLAGGEHLEADKVEYNLREETGTYYNVRGTTPA